MTIDLNKGKLLPCPFCGVTPKIEIEAGDSGYEQGGSWEYLSLSASHKESCPLYLSYECGDNSGSIQIVSLDRDDVAEFINAWNTRHDISIEGGA